MGKKQSRQGSVALAPDAEVPVVGMREPCPCGSGKRYKACHGRSARIEAVRYVERPFEGLDHECDWVALREIVPAATGVVRLTAEYGGGEVTVASVLPMAWPALHRADGTVLVGLQTHGGSGDASRDVAAALLAARDLEPGSPVPDAGLPGPGPRLQDVLDPAVPFEVTVHEGFDYWFEATDELTPEIRESLEEASGAAMPTVRLSSVSAAYWVQAGARRHLRWVLPHPEAEVLDGLARLHAQGQTELVPGSRYVGSFRTNGLVAPVWDLADDTTAADLEQPMAQFEPTLLAAMALTQPLTPLERRAKAGVISRQVTLR
jgi:Family of unknown function (DUF5926)/SEC-C motif